MRQSLPLLAMALILAGCGTTISATSAPTATVSPPKHTPPPGAKYTHAPAMTINTKHRYLAVINSTDGTFTIRLLPKVAPVTVNNFVFLARHGYYNGNPFHRILAPFMIQTGDPTGTGFGGPGYEFKDEPVHMAYTPGIVAMANHGPNTNGSQFFIVTGPQAKSLPPSYTIFGKVASGMKVVEKLANTPVTYDAAGTEISKPLKPVFMKTVTIRESP